MTGSEHVTQSVQRQRRGRRIAMSPEELDRFLAAERMCRVATVGRDGSPHVSPLWFAWDGAALWLYSVVKSQRWANVQRDPRVSVVVDAGHAYGELRGVELLGRISVVGEVPRTGLADADVEEAERLYRDKYGAGEGGHDGRHAWLRLVPEKIVSWDFTKLGG